MASPLLRVIKIIIGFYLVVGIIIWLSSPYVIRYFLVNYLNENNLQLSESSSIGYNPLISSLTFNDVVVLNKEKNNKKVLSVKELLVEMKLRQLFFDNIDIAFFKVDSLYLHSQLKNGNLSIAGMEVTNLNDSEDVPSSKLDFSYRINIPFLNIEDSIAEIEIKSVVNTFKVKSLSLTDIGVSFDSQRLSLNLDGTFNEAKLGLSFDAETDIDASNINIDLDVENLNLGNYAHLVSDSISEISGTVAYQGKHQININKDNFRVTVENPKLSTNKLTIIQDNSSLILDQNNTAIEKAVFEISDNNSLYTLALNKLDVNLTNVHLQDELGTINIKNHTFSNGKVMFSFNENDLNLNTAFDNVTIENNELTLKVNNTFTNIEKQHYYSKAFAFNFDPNANITVSGNATASLMNGKFSVLNENNLLASVKTLTLEDVTYENNESLPEIIADNVQINDVVISDDLSNDTAPLITFDTLSINRIAINQTLLTIDELLFSNIESHVEFDKNRDLKNLITLPTTPLNKVAEPNLPLQDLNVDIKNELYSNENVIPSETLPAPFNVKISQIKTSNETNIHIVDNSVSPKYQREIKLSNFNINNIDSKNPKTNATLNMKGVSDKYSKVEINGEATPFASPDKYTITAKFSEVGLTNISPYFQDDLDYEIESGELDLTLNADISELQVNGTSQWLIKGLDLIQLEKTDENKKNSRTSMPLSSSINMLKDDNGVIDIDVPLKGDVRSPEFSFSGLVNLMLKQATLTISKEYLMTTLVPYVGVATIVMAAGKHVMKLKINDLNYLPKQTDLSESKVDLLIKFAQLFKDKKVDYVKLCAYATPQDIDKVAGQKITNDEDKRRLNTLSNERVSIFKEYMIESMKLSSSQLLSCKPKIDIAKGAKARIKFVL